MDARTFVALALVAIVIGMAGHLLRLRKPLSHSTQPIEKTEDRLTIRLARTATTLTTVISAFIAPVGNIWITGDAPLGTMFMVIGASLALCMLLPLLLSVPFDSVRGVTVWRLMARLSGVSSRGLVIGWGGIAGIAFVLGAFLVLLR